MVFSLVRDTDPVTIGNKFRTWYSGMDPYVIAPESVRYEQGRVRAFVSNPDEREAKLCVRYGGRRCRWMTFDGTYEEWKGSRLDEDDRCEC